MLIAVCSERSSCPCFAAALAEKPVSRSDGSWNSQGTASPKRKYRPRSTGEGFCRVKQTAKWSGVLRGGKSFRDNPRWGSVQNEHDHILWMNLNQSTKSMGFTRKIPRHVECVKRVLKNLLKWSKKSMTHLVALGKNTLCESEQTPFSVCGRSFYCRQQQDVAFLTIV